MMGIVPQINDHLAARRLKSNKVLVFDGNAPSISQMDANGRNGRVCKTSRIFCIFHRGFDKPSGVTPQGHRQL